MRFLIAPDKFKESLSAMEVAENIAAGIRSVLPDAEIDLAPVADGGEGTAEILRRAMGGEWRSCLAHDPLGREIEARYVWSTEPAKAVMELSEAAGLWRIAPGKREIMRADTFGVGEMLLDVKAAGAADILLGLGGSATNDGGVGLARALGFRFLAGDRELTGGPVELAQLTRIVPPVSPFAVAVIAACDVQIPLAGPSGAAVTFAIQKGATADQIAILDDGLRTLADRVLIDLGLDLREEKGAGAAGGAGFGLAAFAGAKLCGGFEIVAEAIRLRERIEWADVVITGEGRLDRQTLDGKAPAGVARLAITAGKPVFAIVGRSEEISASLFTRVYQLSQSSVTTADAIKHAPALLRQRSAELAHDLLNRKTEQRSNRNG